VLGFSFVSIVLLSLLQRLQPLPPEGLGRGAVSTGVAFTTAVSFVTNTNWQSYVPETTMGHFVQMAGLTVQNFLAGLMVGRTPEYLGKKLGKREVTCAAISMRTMSTVVLLGAGIALPDTAGARRGQAAERAAVVVASGRVAVEDFGQAVRAAVAELTTVFAVTDPSVFTVLIAVWLWFTVLFAHLADLQAPRGARNTGLPLDRVKQLIAANTSGGGIGVPGVSVLPLNWAVRAAAGGAH
jgi:hypothetical protein